MTDWLLQHLRLSFIATSEPASMMLPPDESESLFSDVWGVEVELDEKKRGNLFRRRQANLASSRIEIIEQHNRTDIMWMSQSSLEMASFEGNIAQAALGKASEIEAFLNVFGVLASKFATTSRMALGGIAFIPKNTIHEAYAVLSDYVPNLKIEFGKVKDFSIQINRPTSESIDENLSFDVNRIINLNAMSSKFMAGTSPDSMNETTADNWAQLQFDINTDSAHKNTFTNDQKITIKKLLIEGLDFVLNHGIR
ncbi:hypothetical protein [Gluconobacter japonicus]|uniref:hypothetical protein n=1 Tax=Gluconobacter japonicus TaxID=376620 RepID=UPI0039EB86B8